MNASKKNVFCVAPQQARKWDYSNAQAQKQRDQAVAGDFGCVDDL